MEIIFSEDDDSTYLEQSNEEISSKEECLPHADEVQEQLQDHSNEDARSRDRPLNSLLYLCYEDSVRVYKTKSIMEVKNFSSFASLLHNFLAFDMPSNFFKGKSKHKHKMKLAHSCSWASTFKKDGPICGLVFVYRTGDLEVR